MRELNDHLILDLHNEFLLRDSNVRDTIFEPRRQAISTAYSAAPKALINSGYSGTMITLAKSSLRD